MRLNRDTGEFLTDKVTKADIDKNRQDLINIVRVNSNFVLLTSIKKIELKILTQLQPVISELCDCFSINANQASITLTNHLLEKTLKAAIVLYEGRDKINDYNLRIDEVFKEAYDKYDKIDMEQSINKCCNLGLINKVEKKKLVKIRDLFRNPYSHGQTTKILDGVTQNATVGHLNTPGKVEEHNLKVSLVPFLQGDAQLAVAKKYGFDYFKIAIYIIAVMDNELYKIYSSKV